MIALLIALLSMGLSPIQPIVAWYIRAVMCIVISTGVLAVLFVPPEEVHVILSLLTSEKTELIIVTFEFSYNR